MKLKPLAALEAVLDSIREIAIIARATEHTVNRATFVGTDNVHKSRILKNLQEIREIVKGLG